MCSIEQIKELAERNAVYEFEKRAKMYGKEYIRYYYNKLAELNGSINSTCNCQHNSNSRDNEPCCRCNSKHTHADRIRKMSDAEMAKRIASSPNFNCADYCDSFTQTCAFNCNKKGREIALKWLQSEVKVEESEEK